MLEVEMAEERLAVEARFRALVAMWDLGRSEVAALLSVDADALGLDLVPRFEDGVAEHRLRLLVEIGSDLATVIRDARDVPLWLREVDPDDVDDVGGPPTPLAFMSGAIANLRAMRDVLRARRL